MTACFSQASERRGSIADLFVPCALQRRGTWRSILPRPQPSKADFGPASDAGPRPHHSIAGVERVTDDGGTGRSPDQQRHARQVGCRNAGGATWDRIEAFVAAIHATSRGQSHAGRANRACSKSEAPSGYDRPSDVGNRFQIRLPQPAALQQRLCRSLQAATDGDSTIATAELRVRYFGRAPQTKLGRTTSPIMASLMRCCSLPGLL